jgi:membrane protease YdiL (CAAX protease family)
MNLAAPPGDAADDPRFGGHRRGPFAASEEWSRRATWSFVCACVLAGALAVPLRAVGTPLSAAVAGLIGLLGLRVWRWSHLPDLMRSEEQRGLARLVQPGLCTGLGLVVGLLLLAVIRIAVEPAVPSIGVRIAKAGTLPVWRRALIIYVAAVGEELVFRLLLLSAIAGLATRLLRHPARLPKPRVVWLANILSALAFAAVHLPAWTGTTSLSVGVALSVLILNAVAGVFLGYVFVTRGIAAAMWAHAGADCAIQLLGPLTG